jgi:antitoxin component YwqK of YwqJK toxin-antitoxin module
MKLFKISFALILFFYSNILKAQNEEFPKLEELFVAQKYEDCIEKAEKYSEKDKKQPFPYYYTAFSNFEMYKLAESEKEKNKLLKKALQNLKTAQIKDKEDVFKQKFIEKIKNIQAETHIFANSIYEKSKEESKYFYNQLASIYNDTTLQFRELNGLIDEKNNSEIGIDLEAKAKIGPNVTDENGLKQGLWRKIYPNGQVAYEARFKNNLPIGKVLRYHENGKIQAELTYPIEGEDFASVLLYDNQDILIAEGFYRGTQKDSTWKYYSTDRNLAEAEAEQKKLSVKSGKIHYLVMQEGFKNSKKHGADIKYFPSGNMAQVVTWKEGILHGISREFFTNGNVKTEFVNKNDERTGVYNQFYANGRPEIKGYYAGGHKHGKWIYYTNTGEIEREIIYIFGVAKNQNELDEEETKRLLEFEQNKGKLEDPENYKNNPDELFRKY